MVAETILTAHRLYQTCPRFDVSNGRITWRANIERDKLAEALFCIHTLAGEGRLILTDVARASQERLKVEDEDIRVCLATARLVHPALGGRFVVEGRKRDRWYLTVVLRLHPGEMLEVLDLY